MLELYDLLLLRNQRVMDTYLANINDFLSAFCTQLDDQSTRTLNAKVNERLTPFITLIGQRLHPDPGSGRESKQCKLLEHYFGYSRLHSLHCLHRDFPVSLQELGMFQ